MHWWVLYSIPRVSGTIHAKLCGDIALKKPGQTELSARGGGFFFVISHSEGGFLR